MPSSKRPALARFFGRILIVAAIGLIGMDGMAIAAPADAQGADQAGPVKRTKKQQTRNAAAAPVSNEGRHEVCLAFLRRHGYTCDTWVEPTCGADSGYFRPPECVRPHAR
jgi:hypothetical protein